MLEQLVLQCVVDEASRVGDVCFLHHVHAVLRYGEFADGEVFGDLFAGKSAM